MASIEMQTIAPPVADIHHQHTAQYKAMEPLENAIGYLGANRETLEGLKALHSRKSYRPETNDYGNLHQSFFKRGTAKHHRDLAKDMRSTNRYFPPAPIKDIANVHEAIANRIDEVKAAHEALGRTHPTLAWKDGSMGKKNRKYLSPTGATVSLGNYHGKTVTEDGTPKTFKKGGRKTKKRKRKTRKRKRKTRKRKHKRKTKKHKRKTKKHRR